MVIFQLFSHSIPWAKYDILAFERLDVRLISVAMLVATDITCERSYIKHTSSLKIPEIRFSFFFYMFTWGQSERTEWNGLKLWAELEVTVQEKKKEKKSRRRGWGSSEDEGVKGGVLVIIAILRMWLVLRKKKKKGASDVAPDLICSHNVYNHQGPASEWKTVLKKMNL